MKATAANLPIAIAVIAANTSYAAEVPFCDPKPTAIRVDLLPDDRESRVPHQGDVTVEFTVDLLGHASDPVIISSTDPWFDNLVLQSVPKWKYSPPSRPCRLRVPVHFKLKP